MKELNYFKNVIKNENQFSQLLLNIINNSLQLRQIVETFFFANVDIEFSILNSQKRDRNGQPDINVELKDGGFAIIEVKTQDSELTRNQPEGYAQTLKEKKAKSKHLFFLIPRYYKHEKDIIDRFKVIEETNDIDFKIFYWNDLVKHFIKLIGHSTTGNEILLKEIVSHLHEKFGFNNITFETNQIEIMNTNIIPSTILKLNEIINSLIKSFSYKDYEWDNKPDSGYGEGFAFLYKKKIFVGYFFGLWTDKNACLILLVNKDMVDELFLNSFVTFFSKYDVVQDYGTNFKFLDISAKVNESNNVEQINEMIMQFFNQTPPEQE